MKLTLNIISDSYNRVGYGGPNKVIINTLKGLEKIGYPYVINKDIRDYKYNWVHDSVKGLIEVGLNKTPAVIGPNIVVMPKNLPQFRPSLNECIYLHPSQWCIDLWKNSGFDECQMSPWPVGIDTEDFKLTRHPESNGNVMIYFKRRDPVLLNSAISIVKKTGLNPQVIKYGEYNEEQYKKVLSTSKFGVWIGISESQGIGLQEALASGLPLIVCDVNSLFESSDIRDFQFRKNLKGFKPTSVPYFDESCGMIVNDFSRLEESVNEMIKNSSYYNNREFVINNLSIEKIAYDLLSFFEKLEHKNSVNFIFPGKKKSGNNFKLSFRGKLIYSFFLIKRKGKTFFRLAKKRLMSLTK
jgi:hypothetical protein